MSEGIGRTISDGQPVLQALGIISYDDESGTYRNAGIQREPVAITQQFQFRLEKTTIVGLCLRDRPVAGIQGTCKGRASRTRTFYYFYRIY